MSTTIAVRHGTLEQAASDVRTATQLLRQSSLGAVREVAALLADWQGAAADSFATAFDGWDRAAVACLETLEALGIDLARTDADLAGCDATVTARLARLDGLVAGSGS